MAAISAILRSLPSLGLDGRRFGARHGDGINAKPIIHSLISAAPSSELGTQSTHRPSIPPFSHIQHMPSSSYPILAPYLPPGIPHPPCPPQQCFCPSSLRVSHVQRALHLPTSLQLSHFPSCLSSPSALSSSEHWPWDARTQDGSQHAPPQTCLIFYSPSIKLLRVQGSSVLPF